MILSHRKRKLVFSFLILSLVSVTFTILLINIILEPNVNHLTGRVVSKVNITSAPPSVCNFTLYQGENLISFHCMNGMFAKEFILQNFTADYDSIFSYKETDGNDHWKSYNPSLPAWVSQDLSYMHDYEGYWLLMNENSTFYFDGFFNSNSQAQLYAGWNLIGYPRENPNTPAVTFASIAGNYNLVLQFRKENNTWYYYSPGDPNSTLTMIETDYGYWINMTSNDVWVYP